MLRLKMLHGETVCDAPEVNDFLEGARVKNIFAAPSSEPDYWQVLIFYRDRRYRGTTDESELDEDVVVRQEILAPLTPEEEVKYNALRKWRGAQAGKEGLAAFMIAHNNSLKQVVQLPVQTIDDLKHVKGFGDKRIEKYGAAIVEIMQRNDPEQSVPGYDAQGASSPEP